MGGFFGAVSKQDCVLDIFFGVDYHSHLGTRRGGMAIYDPATGFQRQIHNIENTPFRTKFEADLSEFHGSSGIGCISDTDPQPLLVRSHLGVYAITTVGIINNAEKLIETYFSDHGHQFMAMSNGKVNATELTAALINQKDSLLEGLRHAQEIIDGSSTVLLLTPDGILAARDRLGRLPVLVGQNENGCCVSFESFAYQKLGYQTVYELGPGEIVRLTADGYTSLSPAGDKMRICAFLWTYYGYPNSNYEGMNVEVMRYRNGEIMARDEVAQGRLPKVGYVAGVPDSGILHAQEEIDGSLTLLLLTEQGEIIAARDRLGRLPVLVGRNDSGCCVSFESFAYHKLDYHDAYELGPREIVRITADGFETLSPAGQEMKICGWWPRAGCPRWTMWQVCRTPASPTPSALPTAAESPLPAPLSNTRLPGPGLLCLPMPAAPRRSTCAPPAPPSCTAANS